MLSRGQRDGSLLYLNSRWRLIADGNKVGCLQSILICTGMNQELLIPCTAVSCIRFAVSTSRSCVVRSQWHLLIQTSCLSAWIKHILSRHELTPAVWRLVLSPADRPHTLHRPAMLQATVTKYVPSENVCQAALLFKSAEKTIYLL
jgi:hypothetical protein